ncbi:hypothetical protein AB833_15200 [Chromatiales bacterium (ex Bugula neritina AB1)]|nr:hypothetical protein AB833_15200 [Chromatiales bacterium (ex Bugula neritina AB1)]
MMNNSLAVRTSFLALVIFWPAIAVTTWAAEVKAPTPYRDSGADNEQLIDQLNREIRLLKASVNRLSGSEAERNGLALTKQLLRRSELLQLNGLFNLALLDLQLAAEISASNGNPLLQSMSIGALGELFHKVQNIESFQGVQPESEKIAELLQQSHDIAMTTGVPQLISIANTRIGNWYQDSGENDSALQAHKRAVYYADQSNSILMQSSSRIPLIDSARVAGKQDLALITAQEVVSRSSGITSTNSRMEILLKLAGNTVLLEGKEARFLSKDALVSVIGINTPGANRRVRAAAFGELSSIYVAEGDTERAIDLTQRAIALAPDAHHLAYKWERTLGRAHNDVGDRELAILAYRRAVSHIDRVRPNIPISYDEGRSSFQSEFAPVYLELADALLIHSDAVKDQIQSQNALVEAQMILEQLKGSELQDYYRGACVIEQASSIGESYPPGTAILYPVILDKRLAIILNVGDSLRHISVPVDRDTLGSTVGVLAELLRLEGKQGTIRRLSRNMYQWLIDPISDVLAENKIDTIVYVPDGVLRTVPLAAFWNQEAEQYLFEQYQIATVPGLTLMNPEQLSRQNRTTLVAGLREPGDVIAKLPAEYYTEALSDNAAGVRGGIDSRSAGNDEIIRQQHVLEFVQDEVETLRQASPATKVLYEEEFSLTNFSEEVRNNPYRVIHVASHGWFGGKAEDSFIMAHDDLLKLNQLSDLFKSKQYSEKPVELLVLSACQTAKGNDLAPLGLSGVALASGARSVLGSLWLAADESTQLLMETFYANLSTGKMTKSAALQAAQREVRFEFDHPYYWSNFILVGNWL